LRPIGVHRMLGRRGVRQRCCGSSHVTASAGAGVVESKQWRAGARPYLGPRTMVRRHDDGWGARRVGRRWVRSLILSRASTQRGGGREIAGADRGHQLIDGHGTHRWHLRRPPGRAQVGLARRHRVHADCDSSGARFCVRPPGPGFNRYGHRAWPPACGSRRNPGNRAERRTWPPRRSPSAARASLAGTDARVSVWHRSCRQ
jgi:hypothetical protein